MCLSWNKKKKLTARMHGVESLKIFYIYLKYTSFQCLCLCFLFSVKHGNKYNKWHVNDVLYHRGKISTINTQQVYNPCFGCEGWQCIRL